MTTTKTKLLGVQLEITSQCNFSCKFCPVSVPQSGTDEPRRKFVEPQIAYKVIDAIKDLDLYFLTFAFVGEPMMNPKLFDYMKHARQYDLPVFLVTNGTLFKESHFAIIKELGLGRIKLSVQVANPDEFGSLRGVKLDYYSYLEKINVVLKARQQELIDADERNAAAFQPVVSAFEAEQRRRNTYPEAD